MANLAETILIVEDEPQMVKFLRASLAAHGYKVLEAVTAAEGELMTASYNPDVVLMDLGLPDMDGLQLAARLREWCKTPIIVISARGREEDKVQALDAGADDYLTKPFGTRELMARIRVALRHRATREGGHPEPVFEVGDVRVDLAAREVFRGGERVHMTPNEFKLLAILVKHAGMVLTHQQLLKAVWGDGSASQSHYLRVYMNQLRQKLEEESARPKFLITEPGVGYRLRVE